MVLGEKHGTNYLPYTLDIAKTAFQKQLTSKSTVF